MSDIQKLLERARKLSEGPEENPIDANKGIDEDAERSADRSEFLYFDPVAGLEEQFAQCTTCAFWTGPEKLTCLIHGPKVKVSGDMFCKLYVPGKPNPAFAGHEAPNVTPAMSGLGTGQTRCEYCAFFAPETSKCGKFHDLNTALPNLYNLRETVHPKGCCNGMVLKEPEEDDSAFSQDNK